MEDVTNIVAALEALEALCDVGERRDFSAFAAISTDIEASRGTRTRMILFHG